MHIFPDAAGCFDNKDGSYVYVSNSESIIKTRYLFGLGAGVGAFTFDSNGDVTEYKRILEGRTLLNCGGGKTPWGTWMTGEEHNGGDVWEVDHFGERCANRTWFGVNKDGIKRGRNFESAICDDRDTSNLRCFATIDQSDGELLRLTPRQQILKDAQSSGDFSKVLTSEGDLDYLLLDEPSKVFFDWTQDLHRARENAGANYKSLEGIDHHNGTLYLTSKKQREVIILDLDNMTYEKSTTINGTFDEQPDQIVKLLSDSDGYNDMLYFVEDGGFSPGVFARDMDSGFHYAILGKFPQKILSVEDEVTGLAFCANNTKLMVSFQRYNLLGKVIEVKRKDGHPFSAKYFNLSAHQYHQD